MKKKLFLLWILCLFCFSQLWADAGIWHSSINLTINGQSAEYEITNNDTFGDSKLPEIINCYSTVLRINSLTVDVWKDKSGNICGGSYIVNLRDSANKTIISQVLKITWESETTSEYGSLNQVWKNTEGVAIDLSQLPIGKYLLSIRGNMTGSLSSDDGCSDNFMDQTISCQFVIEDRILEETLLTSNMNGFVGYSVLGDQEWYWDTNRKYAKISGYRSGTNYDNEDWLVSKSFDLSKAQNATLSFTHIINYAVDMQAEQTLWVSTNYVQGTNPTTAAWTQLSGFTYPDGNSWDKAESGEISIPTKFLKDNVSFAFKYTSTTSGSATWEVYNFTLKASSEIKTPVYTIEVKSDNVDYGTVSGGGSYEEGTIITITASAKEGYEFVRWNDESIGNPRQVIVTKDATYTAYFEKIEEDKPEYQDYYVSVEGKFGAALKTALNKVIKNHKDVGYGGLYEVYETADDKDGQVWDMYSTCTWYHGNKKCGNNYSNVCDCYNREHTIPQSWFDERTPMKSDAFHVYPTDGKVNGIRSNHPHGETNAAPIGGKALGKIGKSSVSGYSGTVYEPDDEYKGDIARTYFYFVTCYEDQLSPFDRNDVLTGDTYPSLTYWFYNLMLDWHREDPVSEKELVRNEAVYEYQNNRNPFIDYPELVEHIWGNKKSEAFYFNSTAIDDVEIVKYDVIVSDGRVVISGLNSNDVMLVDLSGRILHYAEVEGDTYSIVVEQKGVYLLRIDNAIIKIIF